MLQLDASLRVASPTSIEHSWMFCRSTVKQHSQQRVQKMCTRPKLRPRGRERTELRDHLEDGSSVPTFSRKKQSMFEWLGCDATAALLCSKQWTTCLEFWFRVPKQINLLEAEELVSLVRRLVGTGMRSRRVGRSGQSCLDERWQRDVPAATHSTTSANSCANCVCLRTPSWANPSDAPSRSRLVESWRAAPLVLPWAPSTAHLRDPESRWGRRPPRFSGYASPTTLVQSRPEAALTGICGTRSGHAP